MKKNILILLCLGILLVPPNLALSDCLDFGRVTSWYVQDENTIIYYSQNTPVAKIVLQDCTVNSSSNIRLLKTYMCEEDSLLIDGEECAILSLTSASSGSL
ncbi:MAG TPA: hypothetical protein VMV04_14080 [Thermodesulfobacteriota bacterium]|nr:hypothetical protein [Thermodesulfobacteriota bacterium]